MRRSALHSVCPQGRAALRSQLLPGQRGDRRLFRPAKLAFFAKLVNQQPRASRVEDLSLADIIAFESSSKTPPATDSPPSSTPSKVSGEADGPGGSASSWSPILEPFPLSQFRPPRPPTLSDGVSAASDDVEEDVTRRVLKERLESSAPRTPATSSGPSPSKGKAESGGSSGSSTAPGAGRTGGSSSGSSSSNSASGSRASPSWATALFDRPGPELQRQAVVMPWEPQLDFAEPMSGSLELLSQEADDLARELPPLQSILDLTSASEPPQRSGAAATVSASGVGRRLEDGSGELPDGTRWEKKTGDERGENGLWKKWTVLRGGSPDGKVQWEETWWEVSDWTGMREMGARKSGNKADGSAWREEWNERISHDSDTLKMVIERDAHKWARDASNDEWEEKWGEHYVDGGHVSKYADKWAKAGADVWHEKWGEDYPGDGSCVKYTDKWAERLLEGGATEQWGDKWTESFGDGKGTKHGEVWSAQSNGSRYNRWWNEEHYGDGRVRKYGNSTGGEYWDAIEYMDTYYNPIPHFGFHHALGHSPKLVGLPLLPLAGSGGGGGGMADDLDGGMDSL